MSEDERTALLDRIGRLEKRLAEYDELLKRITVAARAHPVGRVVLKMIGTLP
jgi:hypothetical protein